MATTQRLRVSDIGPSNKAAIRALMHAFRERGWRDHGAALAAVRALSKAHDGLTTAAIIDAFPPAFFISNDISKADACRMVESIAASKRR